MEGRDLGDNQILGSTLQETENGKVRFKTTLPSGRELVSEYMNPDDATGKTVISWCEHVRQQVDVDSAEENAVKKREAAGDITPEKETSTAGPSSSEVDPYEYAVQQRDAYYTRIQILEGRIDEQKAERKIMRRHYEQWETVVKTLRGEIEE